MRNLDGPPRLTVEPDPARVDPAVLAALLSRHGWLSHRGTAGRYARWTPPGGSGGASRASLLVPQDRTFPDCTDLLAEALTALARSGAPSAAEILAALATPSDEIRWERDTPTSDSGAVYWSSAEQLRAAARAMLLAGALATRERTGYHGARYRGPATDELDLVRIGAVSGGSRLTAFVPLPGGRATTGSLLRALHAVRDAIDYQRTAGGMEVFDAAVEAGACTELTDAVIALIRGAEGVRISFAWAPAAPPRDLPAQPEPVEFTPGDLEPLRRAGERYRHDEPSLPVCVTGVVVRLRRDAPAGPGTVRLRVIAGADVAQVRAVLDEDAYRIAGQAHLVGLPIRLSGRLESRGGFRRITGASGVTPVEVEEAERDRLLKSLHENLDFFDEACGG